MSDVNLLAESAVKNIQLLRRLNKVVLGVAVAVYMFLLGVAVFAQLPPMALFATCVMLAELLVFQIVRTLSDHLDLLRSRAEQ